MTGRLVWRSAVPTPVRCGSGPTTASEKAAVEHLLGWIAQLRATGRETILDDAFTRGSIDDAMGAFDWAGWEARISEGAAEILHPAYAAGLATIVGGEVVTVPADVTLLARAWANTYALDLAERAVSKMEARAFVVDAIGRGWSVPRLATSLRSVIGLDGRSAASLGRYGDALRDVTDVRWAKLMDARYAKLIRRRATMIARTELIRATNQGRLAGFQRAAATGVVSPDATKRWLATESDRTCEDCMMMDGTEVPLADDFPGDVGDAPPLHPNCRCTILLIDPALQPSTP